MAECRRIDPNHVGPHCGCFGDACALDAPRPTSELAADVRAGFVRAFDPDAKLRLPDPVALAALAALVARITDLEAQLAAERKVWAGDTARAVAAEAQVADLEAHATRVTDEWQAAEAQVAALTQANEAHLRHAEMARDTDLVWKGRAEAAEAALAEARQALTFYAAEATYVEGDEPHPTEFATYLTPIDADNGDIARHALAATDTTEPA